MTLNEFGRHLGAEIAVLFADLGESSLPEQAHRLERTREYILPGNTSVDPTSHKGAFLDESTRNHSRQQSH